MSHREPAAVSGNLEYRVTQLENEVSRQREATHTIRTEIAALRLIDERMVGQLDRLTSDMCSLRKTLVTVGISVVGAAIVFAFSAFQLLGTG